MNSQEFNSDYEKKVGSKKNLGIPAIRAMSRFPLLYLDSLISPSDNVIPINKTPEFYWLAAERTNP